MDLVHKLWRLHLLVEDKGLMDGEERHWLGAE